MSTSLRNTSLLASALAGLSSPFIKAADAMRNLGSALPRSSAQYGSARSRRGSRSNRTAEKCAEVGHLWRVIQSEPRDGEALCFCGRCKKVRLVEVCYRPNNDKLNLRRSDRLRMQKEQAQQPQREAA